jgi:uncharacterized lipoprotein YddW (UPF0748 family)
MTFRQLFLTEMKRNTQSGLAVIFLLGILASGGVIGETMVSAESARPTPPPPQREFRGAWVATVGNSVWPSKPGLPVAEQKSELLALLDRAAQLKMNAIIFQVRPACDAMYASKFEPWSEYLTGKMGQAPVPFYDPLEFAIAEAHKRGLELHAWFNPYRAHHFKAVSPISANHVSRTRPGLVREYGRYLWLDPGEPDVQDYSLNVVLDVVKRYDVDGIHFDDYFYPYEEKDSQGRDLDFPDDASWKKFGTASGLSRDDWRRENVNKFIKRSYDAIKAAKPWVKFGISPFGIWRPGNPPQIKGLDAYARLYADARKWLANGWVDYFVPQLYWGINPKEQSFPALLDWWNGQNPKRRHIWPGLDATKTANRWKPEEILAQVRIAAQQPVSAGHVHWNMKSVMQSSGLRQGLERRSYQEPALVPAMPWLNVANPPPPSLTINHVNNSQVNWSCGTNAAPKWWVVQARRDNQWRTEIFPGNVRSASITSSDVDAVAITAVNRAGELSAPAVSTIPRQAAR